MTSFCTDIHQVPKIHITHYSSRSQKSAAEEIYKDTALDIL